MLGVGRFATRGLFGVAGFALAIMALPRAMDALEKKVEEKMGTDKLKKGSRQIRGGKE